MQNHVTKHFGLNKYCFNMTVFLLTDKFNIVWICGIRRNHGYVGAVRALFPLHPSLTVKNLNEQFEIH